MFGKGRKQQLYILEQFCKTVFPNLQSHHPGPCLPLGDLVCASKSGGSEAQTRSPEPIGLQFSLLIKCCSNSAIVMLSKHMFQDTQHDAVRSSSSNKTAHLLQPEGFREEVQMEDVASVRWAHQNAHRDQDSIQRRNKHEGLAAEQGPAEGLHVHHEADRHSQ